MVTVFEEYDSFTFSAPSADRHRTNPYYRWKRGGQPGKQGLLANGVSDARQLEAIGPWLKQVEGHKG